MAQPLSLCYADNLRRNGYGDASALSASLAEWRRRLQAQRPDLLLVDHAPAALLASRDARYPRAASGVGFALPPLRQPMPSLQPWLPLADTVLAEREQRLLAAVNPALGRLGLDPLASASDLFDGCRRFLCVVPELDHYEDRPDEACYGPLEDSAEHPALETSDERAPVFVYLSSSNPMLRPVLEHLVARAQPACIYVRVDTLDWKPVTAPNLRYLTERIDLERLARRCRAAITHGGVGSTWIFLRHAVPVLVCPASLESSLLGYRMQARGLCDSLSLFSRPEQAAGKIDRLLDDPHSVTALPAFSQRYAAHRSDEGAARIAAACLDLL